MADDTTLNRRGLLRIGAQGAVVVALGATAAKVGLTGQATREEMVWQINPETCIWCGRCQTECVLTFSAVKCMRDQPSCGYCETCTGYQAPDSLENREQAENQICPTHAIDRIVREYPYFEYIVDPETCVGCAKCAEGCKRYGNGSMYMQIDHEYCVNCSDCAIGQACPGECFVQVPASKAYYFRHRFKSHQDPWALNAHPDTSARRLGGGAARTSTDTPAEADGKETE